MFAIRCPYAFDGADFLAGGATVLVDDGRIVGVEPAAYEVPDGCEVRAYEGTVLPGLVDGHVHLVCDATPEAIAKSADYAPDELEAVMASSLAGQAAAGVTTVRDLGDLNFCVVERRRGLRAGEPRVVAAGPPITVAGGHCEVWGGAVAGDAGDRHDGLRAAVAERVERGVDVVKVMATGGMRTPGTDVFGTQFTLEELRVLVETAHAAGLPVVAHAHSLAGVDAAVSARVDGIEHATCLTPDGIRLPQATIERIAAGDVAVGLTLGNDPEVRRRTPVPPNVQVVLDRIGMDLEELSDGHGALAGPLWRGGARIANGVDCGVGPSSQHGNAWRAVNDLVTGGMPIAAALAAGTSVAAEACGVGDVTGRLVAGLAADLLVVDGDLAEDPTALARVRAVVLRGEPLT